MKEREVIAKSDKSFCIFIIVMVLIGIPISLNYTSRYSLRWFGIFTLSCEIFVLLLTIIMLFLYQKDAILKEGDDLIIQQGVLKEVISIEKVIGAEIAWNKKGENKGKHGIVTVKFLAENGKEKSLSVFVKNKAEVVESITKMQNKEQ